jgi:hypothetical protein
MTSRSGSDEPVSGDGRARSILYTLTISPFLAASTNKQTVSSVIDLSLFSANDDDTVFVHPCRCGGQFRVTVEALEAAEVRHGSGEVLVQCEGCTERVTVEFGVEVD